MKYCDKCGQEVKLKVKGFQNSLNFKEYYKCNVCGFKKYLFYEYKEDSEYKEEN